MCTSLSSPRNNKTGSFSCCGHRQSFSASSAALCCASLILVSSGVAGFRSITPMSASRIPNSQNLDYEIMPRLCRQDCFAATQPQSIITLFFRDRDVDDNVVLWDKHDVSAVNESHTLPKTKRWPEFLKYDKVKEDAASNQFALDQYLLFIERRYNRLHQEDEAGTVNCVLDSAWKWITHSSGIQVTKRRSALYVLGLADLASSKTFRKSHAPETSSDALELSKLYTTRPFLLPQLSNFVAFLSTRTSFLVKKITYCSIHLLQRACAIVSTFAWWDQISTSEPLQSVWRSTLQLADVRTS